VNPENWARAMIFLTTFTSKNRSNDPRRERNEFKPTNSLLPSCFVDISSSCFLSTLLPLNSSLLNSVPDPVQSEQAFEGLV